MRGVFLSVVFLITIISGNAQEPNFEWAKGVGAYSGYWAFIAADDQGNTYTTGGFHNQADFDPGIGVFNLKPKGGTDIFVFKLNPQGDMEWAKSIGGFYEEVGNSIAVDALENVYITGNFRGTVDFDPGAGVFNLTSTDTAVGLSDIFILKLNTAGNFEWAKQIGGARDDIGNSIALDKQGNVLSTGYFSSTVDFDPGNGEYKLSYSSGMNIYVLKLDASGNFIWARGIGGNYNSEGFAVTTDKYGNVYTTGYFKGLMDFDPGAGYFYMNSDPSSSSPSYERMFIIKLDGLGLFEWAIKLGNGFEDRARAISIDGFGNIYTTGKFNGTGSFVSGAGFSYITNTGAQDVFISKFNSDGQFLWVKKMGGMEYEEGYSIKADVAGNAYIIGTFKGTTDFDPGSNVFNMTSKGGYDIFISKLDTLGNFIWAKSFGGASYDYGMSVALDPVGNIYFEGQYSETIDFDPDNSKIFNLADHGFFVLKLSQETSGIDNTSIPNILTAYPNPTNGLVNLNVVNPNQISIIQIFNSNGVLIYSGGSEGNSIPVNLGSYPSGIYLVKVEDSMGNVMVNKIIKQ